jgi:hypothetical protein
MIDHWGGYGADFTSLMMPSVAKFWMFLSSEDFCITDVAVISFDKRPG